MKVVAVIPAFREENRIAKTVQSVLSHVQHVVVVDDGSEDATAQNVPLESGHVTVIRHRVNRGQGASLKTGTDAAVQLGADVIVHVDADGQHDSSFIPSVITPIQEGSVDVVFGSRFLGESVGMPLARRILLNGARTFNALVVGIPRRVTDPQSGFRAMTASAAKKISFRQDRFAHCSEILRLVTRSDLRWKEVPVRVHYSEDSLKKGQKPWDAMRIVWQLFLGAFTH